MVSKDLFELCDIAANRTERVPKSKHKDIKSKLRAYFLDEPPLQGNLEKQRECLEKQRSYSNGSGTLLHLLCDVPDNLHSTMKWCYKESKLSCVSAEQNARKLSSASNILPLYIRLLAVLHFILTDKTLGFLVKRKNGTRRLLNVDALNNEKETPLFRALHNGNKDLVDTLTQGTIKNGFADVNKSCRGGTTPLLKALSLSSPGSKDRRDIVNRLLQKGADVNAADEAGQTPVWAVLRPPMTMRECMPELIKKGGDPNVRRGSDFGPPTPTDAITPLMAMVLSQNTQMCEILASHESVDANIRCTLKDKSNTTVTIEAVRNFHTDSETSPLSVILRRRYKDLDLSARNDRGETAANVAAKLTSEKLKFRALELLLDCSGRGATHLDLSGEELGNTLTQIVRLKDEKRVFRLMEKVVAAGRADVNAPDFVPLNVAIRSSFPWSSRVMQLLIKHGADVNKSPLDQEPPLHTCIQQLLNAQNASRSSKSPDCKEQLGVCEEKVQVIVRSPMLDKSARHNNQTALDVILGPHNTVLRRLENEESGFWERSSQRRDFGQSEVVKNKAEIAAAQTEVNKWATLIETEPTRREDFLRRAMDALKHLDILTERLSIWEAVHMKLLQFEQEEVPPPALAGREWSDLRHQLSHHPEDSDQGLTTFDDLLTEGTEALTQLRPEAPVWIPPEPAEPSTDIEDFLVKHDMGKYIYLFNSEEITIDDLLNFTLPDDLIDIKVEDEDLSPLSSAVEAEKAVQNAREQWEQMRDKKTAAEASSEEAEAKDAQSTQVNPVGADPTEKTGVEDDSEDDSNSEDEYQDGDAGGEGEDSALADNIMLSSIPENIELTKYAFEWVQRADPHLVSMFIKKIKLLAEGPGAWQRNRRGMSKALKGQQFTPSRYPVRRAKLNKGMRILWQERGAILKNEATAPRAGKEAILVWYIVKHDAISTKLGDIDRCFHRMNIDDSEASMAAAFKGGLSSAGRHKTIPEVLLDPSGNTPLRVFDVMVHELPQLEAMRKWVPPMRLTAKEETIVNTDGLVTILGRSGTGKTVCVAMRMHKDRLHAAHSEKRDFRQVFIARSRALCMQVQRMVKSGGSTVNMTGLRDIGLSRDLEASSRSADGAPKAAAAPTSEDARPMTSENFIDELTEPKFVTIDDFVDIIENSIVDTHVDAPTTVAVQRDDWDRLHRVGWSQFEREFWPTLSKKARKGKGGIQSTAANKLTGKGEQSQEDDGEIVALTVWVQIKSLIKGSVEAAWGSIRSSSTKAASLDSEEVGRNEGSSHDDVDVAATSFCARQCGTPLSREEYMALDDSRCALTPKQRIAAYEYYEIYMQWLNAQGMTFVSHHPVR